MFHYKPINLKKMKKLILVVAVGGLFAMSSCKKDYVCECTYSGGGISGSSSTTINATKKDAEAACSATASSGGTTYSCALK